MYITYIILSLIAMYYIFKDYMEAVRIEKEHLIQVESDKLKAIYDIRKLHLKYKIGSDEYVK